MSEEKLGLSQKEIQQLHNNFKVLREYKMMEKIPFTVSSFPFGSEEEFVKLFDEFNEGDSNVYVKNVIAEDIVKNCLVSFNNEKVSKEEVENFSPEKTNYIIEKFRELSSDIQEYLDGYERQELTEEEVEEYILTDKVTRNINLNFDEETQPIKIKYHILNIKENKEVGKRIKELIEEEDVQSQVRAKYFNEFAYGVKMIDSINGIAIDEDNIKSVGVELIRFVLDRADKLENQVTDVLNSPGKLGENLKN